MRCQQTVTHSQVLTLEMEIPTLSILTNIGCCDFHIHLWTIHMYVFRKSTEHCNRNYFKNIYHSAFTIDFEKTNALITLQISNDF